MVKKILLLCFIFSNTVFSQNIDNTFNTSETNQYDQNYGAQNYNFSLNGFVFKDGSALIAKRVGGDNIYDQQTLIKIDNTGKKDNSFYLDYTLYNGLIDNKMKVFANEITKKFVIVTSDNIIRHFNANGSLINTFVSPVFLNVSNANLIEINKILLQNDNKFLVVGYFDKVNNIPINNIVRLNSDGSIDSTFNTGTGPNRRVKSVIVQNDNKYVAVGQFFQYNGVSKISLVRINTDGTIDNSFNLTGGAFSLNDVKDLIIQTDGKIITLGRNFVSSSVVVSYSLVRFNVNGSRDVTFSVISHNYNPTSLDIQTDGKIITNNIFGNGRPCRLNTNGTKDTSFVTDNFGGLPEYKVISVTNNKVMVFGDYLKGPDTYNVNLTRREIHRLNTNGSIDLTYKPQSGLNVVRLEYQIGGPKNHVNKVEILPSNNLIIKGRFSSYNDTAVRSLMKTDQNGVLDPTFNFPNTFYLDGIESATVIKANHTDDKFYLIKGNYDLIANDTRTIFKFNENGSMDNTYALVQYSGGPIVLANDDKLIIVGTSGSQYRLIKLNENGTVDNSFNSYLFSNPPTKIDFQSNGKMIVKTSYSFSRLNVDGSLDASFSNINYTMSNFIVAPDDKIYYIFALSESQNKLKRLLSNGNVDNSFNEISNCTLPSFVENSKLLINNGQNSQLSNLNSYQIADINGNILNTFQIKDEYNNPIISNHTIQNCNNLLFYGDFVNANNQYNAGIIRYNLNNFVSTPTPVANTYQTFTSGQTLYDLVVNGQNLTWYTTQCPCTDDSVFKSSNVVNSVLPNTTSLVDGTTYFVSQTINGVESNHRLPIKVTQALSTSSFEKLDFKLFPNPTNDFLSIETDFQFEKIKIFNNLGQLVFESNYKNGAQYDLSTLTNGFYSVLIIDENNKNISSKKLIKK